MVIKGDKTTLTVSLDEIKYHLNVCLLKAVTLLIVDMPFSTFQENPEKHFPCRKINGFWSANGEVRRRSVALETIEFLYKRRSSVHPSGHATSVHP